LGIIFFFGCCFRFPNICSFQFLFFSLHFLTWVHIGQRMWHKLYQTLFALYFLSPEGEQPPPLYTSATMRFCPIIWDWVTIINSLFSSEILAQSNHMLSSLTVEQYASLERNLRSYYRMYCHSLDEDQVFLMLGSETMELVRWAQLLLGDTITTPMDPMPHCFMLILFYNRHSSISSQLFGRECQEPYQYMYP
jgi:hypothetical protein